MEKILHLTLKKKWFDMIASGEKKEEYRELKMYWATRLANGFQAVYGIDIVNPDFKDFDFVVFKNGYSKDVRMMKVECKGMEIGRGEYEWGGGGGFKYVIKLGKIISKNF